MLLIIFTKIDIVFTAPISHLKKQVFYPLRNSFYMDEIKK